jgi:hypothetical protein
MILCDQVYREPVTRKCTLLGTFSTIFAPSFPAVHGAMFLYVQLTDGHGEYELDLKISRLEPDSLDGPPLFAVKLPVTFSSRSTVVELSLGLGNLPIPQPGEYRLMLEYRGILIMERRLLAQPVSTT